MLVKIVVALCFVIAIIGGVEIGLNERQALAGYLVGASIMLFVVVVIAGTIQRLDKMDKTKNP